MQRNSISITIPTALYEKIRQKIKGTSFRSVSEYATHILRNAVEIPDVAPQEGSRNEPS